MLVTFVEALGRGRIGPEHNARWASAGLQWTDLHQLRWNCGSLPACDTT